MEITQYRIINIPNEIISIASTVSVPVSVRLPHMEVILIEI